MDAVAAANARREFVFVRATPDDGQQLFDIGNQQVGALLHLHGVTSVAHVAAGQAKVKPAAGVVIDFLRHRGGEGNHVMIQNLFQFTLPQDQPGRVQLPGGAAGLELDKIFAGNDALLDQRLAGEELDLQPEIEFVFVRPNRPHFGARIARNHGPIKTEKARLKRRK